MYRIIRVILESSLESEILRTLRTPSLSDNDSKDFKTSSLRESGTLAYFRLRVFESLRLVVLSDFESLRVKDSPYFKTSSL